MTDPVPQALCDEHHDADRAPCERCGDFVCVDCVPLDAPPRCASCRGRYGIEDVPWEVNSAPTLNRWRSTARAFLTRPTRTLERTRPQRPWPALWYLLNTSAMVIVGTWVVVFVRDMVSGGFGVAQRAVVVPALLAVALATTALVRVTVFHTVARVLGGSGTWGVSVACVAYLQGIVLAIVPLSLSCWVPSLAPLVFSLGVLAFEAFVAVNLTTAARLHHGLHTGRAAAAAWAPFVAVLATVVFGCGFLGGVLDGIAYAS